MKERPILFSGAMVRALLDGGQTQTRRVVKSDLEIHGVGGPEDWHRPLKPHVVLFDEHREPFTLPPVYGVPGDRLWVRETWAQPTTRDPGPTFYRADYPTCVPSGFENVPPVNTITWKPSIHMPRALSRIPLEVTGVRIERLQNISEADSIAEGIEQVKGLYLPCREAGKAHIDPRLSYRDLWDSLNAARGYGWDVNPRVWVVEFRRIEASADQREGG